MMPLLRVLDEYGAERKDRLTTEVIFLSGDKIEGERRAKAANGSLKLSSHVGFSPDGAEGPGNYGLNKECLMTIIASKDNVVTGNFALVQPGIADAPRVIAAFARTCGDTNPPPVEELTQRQKARSVGPGEMGGKRRDNFPGAVPTDETLQALLRRFIRPTNDDATVDRILSEVQAHIKDNAELKKQAIDGWTRILHFGDRYGTPHARGVGRAFLHQLKAENAK